MELSGSSAVVTGGASGIGAAAARQLAARGAKVVVADLQEDAGNAVADQIGGAFCKVDVTNTDDIINAVEMATSMGPLKALVNSAGIGWAQRTVGKDGSYDSAANLEAFQRVININLIGTFDCIRLGATAMSRNEPDEFGERGAICNLASVAAFDGQIGQASYSASKGGVRAMTKSIALDLAERETGIRVNSIHPGFAETPLVENAIAQLEPEEGEQFSARLAERALLGLADPDQIAAAAVFMFSDDSSFMTGSELVVDGGFTAS